MNDLGDILFLPVRHHMYAGNALDLFHLVDDVDAELLAFLLLILCAFQAA